MDSVTQAAQGIYAINDTPAYLVLDEVAALVEPGAPTALPKLLEGIRQVGLDLDRLAYIIVTHIHIDHAGASGALAREAPRARVVVHHRGARHLADPTRLIESTRQVQGEEALRQQGTVIPVPQERMWEVSGGDEITLGTRKLVIIDGPGHAPHHMCIHDPLTDGVFSGEAAGTLSSGQERPRPAVVPPSFDLEDYLNTIARMRALNPSVLYYAHSGPHRPAQRLLDMVEEDLRAYGRIVLEGMKEKASLREISRRMASHRGDPSFADAVGVGGPQIMVLGFAVYFRRQDPSLEMPR